MVGGVKGKKGGRERRREGEEEEKGREHLLNHVGKKSKQRRQQKSHGGKRHYCPRSNRSRGHGLPLMKSLQEYYAISHVMRYYLKWRQDWRTLYFPYGQKNSLQRVMWII